MSTAPVLIPRPNGKTPTIYQIKAAQPAGSHFFDRKSMRFFGQTLKGYHVTWSEEFGMWRTTCGMWDSSGKYMGTSVHFWEAGTLLHVGTEGAVRARRECVNKK